MAREHQNGSEGADWFEAEINRGEKQAQVGETVNAAASVRSRAHQAGRDGRKSPKKPKVKRVNKGFQIEEGRARAWDILVAKMKSHPSNKKTGPELMDEAMDYVLKKYNS